MHVRKFYTPVYTQHEWLGGCADRNALLSPSDLSHMNSSHNPTMREFLKQPKGIPQKTAIILFTTMVNSHIHNGANLEVNGNKILC